MCVCVCVCVSVIYIFLHWVFEIKTVTYAWYMHLKKPWQLFFWDHQGRTFELSWLS